MKTLVIEDDFVTSQVMKEILLSFGDCDIATDGTIGLDYFNEALINNNPYDLIFLDIMMPGLTGQEVLKQIRDIESGKKILGLDQTNIIMSTALDDISNIKKAFKSQAEGYIVKPIDKDKIIKILIDLELV